MKLKFDSMFMFAGAITLLGLAGCASYNAVPLQRLSVSMIGHPEEQAVVLASHIFSRSDCQRYLDRDILAAQYQPILVSIVNNSRHSLILDKKNFSFTCAAEYDVARKVHTSTTGRAVTYGVLGLILWPFFIPAVVDGVGSAQANERLDADFSNKALRDQIIAPHSIVDGLVFVHCSQFNPDFTLTLIDRETNEPIVLSTYKNKVSV